MTRLSAKIATGAGQGICLFDAVDRQGCAVRCIAVYRGRGGNAEVAPRFGLNAGSFDQSLMVPEPTATGVLPVKTGTNSLTWT